MVSDFLKSVAGQRFITILYIIFLGYVASLDSPNWNAVIALLVWTTTIISMIGLLLAGPKKIAEEIDRQTEGDEIHETFVKCSQEERMIYPVVIGCVLVFHGWHLVGILYTLFKTSFSLTVAAEYRKILRKTGRYPEK